MKRFFIVFVHKTNNYIILNLITFNYGIFEPIRVIEIVHNFV